jgi:hypothetical protein
MHTQILLVCRRNSPRLKVVACYSNRLNGEFMEFDKQLKMRAAAAVLLLTFGGAAFASQRAAVKACAAALASELKTDTSEAPAYTIDRSAYFQDSVIDIYASSYVLEVTAKSLKSGDVLKRASCEATKAGQVLRFRTLPLHS